MAYGVRQVPQNIMSVEFKIFDLMTLKQFGISVAILIICFFVFIGLQSFSPWNIVIPVIVILVGAVVIFVPFNGEPFQEFLSNFMEAMISPQRRIWHKKGVILKTAAEKAQVYRFGADALQSQPINNFQNQANPQGTNTDNTEFDIQESKFLNSAPKIENVSLNTQSNNQQIRKPVNDGTTIANHNLKQNIPLAPHQINNQMPVQIQTQPNQQNSNPAQNQVYTQTQGNVIQNQNLNSNAQQSQQPVQFNQGQTQAPQTQQMPIQQTRNYTPQNNNSTAINPLDDVTIKNFIFGSIEAGADKPVRHAVVNIIQNNNVLEITSTNDIGDFKTAYEYPAGNYVLEIKHGEFQFENIGIHHEPIDPVPLTIRPINLPNEKNEEDEIVGGMTGDVFDGNYDAKIFDLGHEYVETSTPSLQTNQNQALESNQSPTQNQVVEENDIDLSNFSIPISGSKKTQSSNQSYTNVANNLFDQANSYKSAVDPIESNSQVPEFLTSEDNIQSNQNINSPEIIIDTQKVETPTYLQPESKVNPSPEININPPQVIQGQGPVVPANMQLYDYHGLPDAQNISFEQNLVNIPNTFNGVLVNQTGYGMAGVFCRIFDAQNNLLTSMYSDNTGKFYSYSPVQNGNYKIIFSQGDTIIVGFIAQLDGKILPAKFISFK